MHGRSLGWLWLVFVLCLTACADTPSLPPVSQYTPQQLAALHWRAVLVAGDGHLQVFDNATSRMRAWLHDNAVPAADITRLSAVPSTIAEGAAPASRQNILHAIEAMHPAADQACLVFITSHGLHDEGVELSLGGVLRPAELDRALAVGCGNAPTVAIVSACFSGSFAVPPMTRANRIVLTAARADRTSFGCRADQLYTFFDRCLLTALPRAPGWRGLYDSVRACVQRREQGGDFVPSEPQASFGGAVEHLPLPHPH